jgi:hypothetical protein
MPAQPGLFLLKKTLVVLSGAFFINDAIGYA